MSTLAHDYARWIYPVFHYESQTAFMMTRRFADGIHAVTIEGRVLDILVERGGHPAALIFFNAAADRAKTPQLPIFSGLTVSQGLPATLIAVSDYSLTYDAQLGLGWYAGGHGAPLQDILPKLLKHLLAMLGCARSICYGGSGGGFAALYYAAQLPDSLPIAVNPQTRLSHYSQPFVRAFARACWEWNGDGAVGEFLQQHITDYVGDCYIGTDKPFVYVQNLSDATHLSLHVKPFMQDMGGGAEPVSCRLGGGGICFRNWGDGHAPLPRDLAAQLLQTALAHHGPWQDFAYAQLTAL